jgi:hypothetical protein
VQGTKKWSSSVRNRDNLILKPSINRDDTSRLPIDKTAEVGVRPPGVGRRTRRISWPVLATPDPAAFHPTGAVGFKIHQEKLKERADVLPGRRGRPEPRRPQP